MRKMIATTVGLIALVAVALVTYQYTKASYYAVGRNDGSIETNIGMLKRLTEIGGVIPACTVEQQREGMGIITVKAEAIYAIAKGPATVSFCMAP